jgi:hypothetical protein
MSRVLDSEHTSVSQPQRRFRRMKTLVAAATALSLVVLNCAEAASCFRNSRLKPRR